MSRASTAVAAGSLAASPFTHRSGQLEVRLAASPDEVAAAQALRYSIFYDEMGAQPSQRMAALGRDIDRYDEVCDHLLVVDHGLEGPVVVGTYRLLRQTVAQANGGFYSASEFDLAPLLLNSLGGRQLLELGRSCVAVEHRNNTTISLLWRGIADYLERHQIGYMFGCASLPGIDPDAHAAALTYLHREHLAPAELRARSHARHHVAMERLGGAPIDPKLAARALPPLIKGYLRVGAKVGDGAFVDHQFRTVDVFIVMPVEGIAARYSTRFRGPGANDLD